MNESFRGDGFLANATFSREDKCVCEHIWALQFSSYGELSTGPLCQEDDPDFTLDDLVNDLASLSEEIGNGTAKSFSFQDVKVIISYATMIIGLPANILILFITAYNWRTKSASSWLVLNLAIADLCLIPTAFLSILKKVKYERSIDGSHRFPQLQCKYDFACPHFFACVSFLSISAIAFDRFYAIVRAGVGDNHGYRYSMIFGTVWTLSFVISFPMIYFAQAVKNPEENYTCVLAWTFLTRDQCKYILNHPDALCMKCPETDILKIPRIEEESGVLSRCEKDKFSMEKIYYATFTIVGFIVPIIVILTSYYFIMQKVHKSGIQVKKIGTKNNGADSRKNFNRTIMIFFVATLICLLPYVSYQVVLLYQLPIDGDYCLMFKNISQSFMIISPILNAVLYSFLGRKFREECLSTFKRIFGVQKRRNPALATDSTAFSTRYSGSRYSKSCTKTESTRVSSTVCTAIPSVCDEHA